VSLAQRPPAGIARIGFLGTTPSTLSASRIRVDALRKGLRDLGHVEGRTFTLEFRWADGRHERLPELAAELVRLKVAVIVAQGTPGALAAKQATSTIPIVMPVVADPVATGLVTSLARPGGERHRIHVVLPRGECEAAGAIESRGRAHEEGGRSHESGQFLERACPAGDGGGRRVARAGTPVIPGARAE
jgi:ABC transporter substrate binding protein